MASSFAPARNIRFFSENNYRMIGSCMNRFAGNFEHAGAQACYVLFSLEEFDRNLVSGIALKEGERIFRAETDRSAMMGIRYLVKVNVERGLVYFLDSECGEEIRFESRGVKVRFMNLLNSAI